MICMITSFPGFRATPSLTLSIRLVCGLLFFGSGSTLLFGGSSS